MRWLFYISKIINRTIVRQRFQNQEYIKILQPNRNSDEFLTNTIYNTLLRKKKRFRRRDDIRDLFILKKNISKKSTIKYHKISIHFFLTTISDQTLNFFPILISPRNRRARNSNRPRLFEPIRQYILLLRILPPYTQKYELLSAAINSLTRFRPYGRNKTQYLPARSNSADDSCKFRSGCRNRSINKDTCNPLRRKKPGYQPKGITIHNEFEFYCGSL